MYGDTSTIIFLVIIFITAVSLITLILYLDRKDKRKVIIYKDKEIIKAKFKDLKKDDIFSLYEPDGHSVKYKNKHSVFKAVSDAYLNEDGISTIDCKPYKKDK